MMIIRGIRFKIPNAYDSYLALILDGINIKKYIWKVSEDEVYVNGINDLFPCEIINGIEFEKLIQTPSYYVVFVNLEAFTDRENLCPISNYEEFLESSCNIVLLVTDNIFVDIYIKEMHEIGIIKKMHKNTVFLI